MTTPVLLEDVLAMALQLTPKDRLALIAQVASSVGQAIDAPAAQDVPEGHWGKALNQLVDEIGPVEMLYPEIQDPTVWVKHLRAEQRRNRFSDAPKPDDVS